MPENLVDAGELITISRKVTCANPIGPNEQPIRAVVARLGYPLDITPNQRQFGPPANWQGGPPGKGCEVRNLFGFVKSFRKIMNTIIYIVARMFIVVMIFCTFIIFTHVCLLQ